MSERAKADLRNATFAAEREIDRLFTTLGRAVAASVRGHAEGGKVTPLTRHLVLSELDGHLDVIYGTGPGQPSPLGDLIVRMCGETRIIVVNRAVQDMRRRLKGHPDLLKAMGDKDA